jgi:hypothetical protein
MTKFKYNDVLVDVDSKAEIIVVAVVDDAICLGGTQDGLYEVKWYKKHEIEKSGQFKVKKPN